MRYCPNDTTGVRLGSEYFGETVTVDSPKLYKYGSSSGSVSNRSGGGSSTSTTSVKVIKEWVLDDGGEATDYVTVTLLRNGDEYSTVTLTEDDGWTYTWTGLSTSYTWTVEETDVPDGFTSSVSKSGTTFTIVNDDVPDDPVESEGSGDGEPGDGDEADVADDPDSPADPSESTTLDESSAASEFENPGDSGLPQTGLLWWPILGLMICGGVLTVIGVIRRKSGDSEQEA